MKEKSKLILLFSFIIVFIGVIIITNLDSNKLNSNKLNYNNLIENLENMDGSLNNLPSTTYSNKIYY